jgi:hypothetical protein
MDGHEKTATYAYNVNASSRQIDRALKCGEKQYGVVLMELCSNYEESYITPEIAEKFRCLRTLEVATFPKKGVIYLTSENFMEMFMELVQTGDPTIAFYPISIEEIYIGGYGLFY